MQYETLNAVEPTEGAIAATGTAEGLPKFVATDTLSAIMGRRAFGIDFFSE